MLTLRPLQHPAPVAILAGLLGACPLASAQDFALQVARADRFFREGILPDSFANLYDPLRGELKGDLSFSLSAEATYNSNVFLSSVNEQSDLILGLTPSLFYTSDPEEGAPCVLTAYYAPALLTYLDDSDLGRLNHSAGASLYLSGAKTNISLFVHYDQFSGADRLAGGYVEAGVLNLGVSASYQIAPRTVLTGAFTASSSDYTSGTQVGSESYSARFGALWAATERFSIGPGVNYSISESSKTGTREAWSLPITCSYLWTDRIDLLASVGPSFYQDSRPGGEDGVNLYLLFTANYAINELWSWRTSIRYDTVPSPTSNNYVVNDLSFATSLVRQLRYGTLLGGITFSLSDYQPTGAVATTLDNEQYLQLFLAYRRTFAHDRLTFDASASYGSNDGQTDWSQFQLSLGLTNWF